MRGTIQEEEWGNCDSAYKEPQRPKFLIALSPAPYFLIGPNPQTPSLAKPRTSRSTLLTAEPGFMGVAPGRGVSIWPPYGSQRSGVWVHFPILSLSLLNHLLTVSVCQKVSTMGQCWEPTTRWYHSQASGLMGSPTVPSTCKDARLCLGRESGREESSEYH